MRPERARGAMSVPHAGRDLEAGKNADCRSQDRPAADLTIGNQVPLGRRDLTERHSRDRSHVSQDRRRMEELRAEIRRHDRKYYVEAGRRSATCEYDRLLERLKQLEAEHPELVTPDSPTQRVGDQPVEGLEQVEHRVPMLSIDNTYSLEELHEFGAAHGQAAARRADRVGRGAEGRRRGRVADLRRRRADPRR